MEEHLILNQDMLGSIPRRLTRRRNSTGRGPPFKRRDEGSTPSGGTDPASFNRQDTSLWHSLSWFEPTRWNCTPGSFNWKDAWL